MANRGQILVVEDSLDLQALLAGILSDEGYDVACASSGQEALNVLLAAKILPDVILLDLMMPDLDGYEFRQKQGADSVIANIPVVVMTADRDIQNKSHRLGAKAYLQKPFLNIDSILNTVSQFFVA